MLSRMPLALMTNLADVQIGFDSNSYSAPREKL